MASELAASENFKYALTTNQSSCTTDVKETGSFTGATANSTFTILNGEEYTTSPGTGTYYLYIWLDEAESNNNTQNKTFNLSLTGTCSNNRPRITSTVYSISTHEFVTGETIPRGTTTYSNYQDAINAFGYNVFLKHTVEEDRSIETNWCWSLNEGGQPDGECYGSTYETENECIADLEDNGYYDEGPSNSPYLCAKSSNKVVVSSEIGFVKDGNVYYLHDWFGGITSLPENYYENQDYWNSHDANDTTLLTAFGSANCQNNNISGYNCNTSSWSAYNGEFYTREFRVTNLNGDVGGQCDYYCYDGCSSSCSYYFDDQCDNCT